MIKLEQAVTTDTDIDTDEKFDRWRERCDHTYDAHCEELVRDYAGKFVAVDGERVVEFADRFEDLERKYFSAGSPRVNVYFILHPGAEPLCLPVGRLPEGIFQDEEE